MSLNSLTTAAVARAASRLAASAQPGLPPGALALAGLAGLQMLHRYGAYAVTAAMVTAAVMARSAPDPGIRAGASTALALNVAQVVLGVSNVLLGTPPWLSAAHLATAAAMLALLVLTTYRVASLPAREARLVAAPAP